MHNKELPQCKYIYCWSVDCAIGSPMIFNKCTLCCNYLQGWLFMKCRSVYYIVDKMADTDSFYVLMKVFLDTAQDCNKGY